MFDAMRRAYPPPGGETLSYAGGARGLRKKVMKFIHPYLRSNANPSGLLDQKSSEIYVGNSFGRIEITGRLAAIMLLTEG
jgi:hypothetical protein